MSTMSIKESSAAKSPNTIDSIKWFLALAFIAGGMIGYYWFADQAQYVRAGIVLLGLIMGFLTISQTLKGREMIAFIMGSRVELSKVVWATKQETVQTTIAVLVFTLLAALFFAGLDWVLIKVTAWLR